jgi:hypothetical protein
MDEAIARRMWQVMEPIHAVTYFSPRSIDALKASGLRGYWMGYFAARAAPMGAVAAPVVEATFYNFAPWLVRRAIPDAWSFATPEAVLGARAEGVTAALAAHDAALPAADRDAARRLLERASDALCCDGRPIAMANAQLEPPDDPIASLWQLVTTLREFRGDGHVAALVVAGLSGLEAHLTLVGTGTISRAVLQGARGFADDEWDAAATALAARGLLAPDGTLTEDGRALRAEVEGATDRAALAPWARLGEDGCAALDGYLRPLTRSIVAAGVIPATNPIGLPAD